jgi:uncharacterized nucleotidyltransferase DUF6036
MDQALMLKALETLDKKLQEKSIGPTQLLIGGGGAFALAYGIPIRTADIDGVFFQSPVDPSQLDPLVKETGRDLEISPDWLNPYFGTFLMSLPPDYKDRLQPVFTGKSLKALAIGLTDLLIMKCFAGREKDMPHAKLLIRKGADLSLAEHHIRSLVGKRIPHSQEALNFLLEAEEQVES